MPLSKLLQRQPTMRISSIHLSWFRGAADGVELALDGKSLVVYGENGSGKSSFVDAIEFILNKGKLRHQSHEYSGRNQENAIPNTHRPDDCATAIAVTFIDKQTLNVHVKPNSAPSCTGGESVKMPDWDYQCTVLRQNEVADFIHSSKGEKYSSLLPLLGLHGLELAAENVRQLSKSVEQQSGIQDLRATVRQSEVRRKEVFDDQSHEEIEQAVEELHKRYCPDRVDTTSCVARCDELSAALTDRVNQSSAEDRCHVALREIGGTDIEQSIATVRAATAKLAGEVDPYIQEKVEVLEAAQKFGTRIEPDAEIACPACGQLVPAEDFRAHVEREKQRLADIIQSFADRRAAIGVFVDNLRDMKANIAKADVKAWRDRVKEGPEKAGIEWIEAVVTDSLRSSLSEELLLTVERYVLPIRDSAQKASKDAPPQVQQLTADRITAEAAKSVINSIAMSDEIARIDALSVFLMGTEAAIRAEIRAQSKAILNEITEDVEAMWGMMHPGAQIEGIKLHLPEDNKAIDIVLKFHGKEQDSPRLTLSEGYRNGLGLSIFLAMARRETAKGRPLFLDDVVVSLDRNHRGMVAEILEKLFADRQVVLLTHDRDWFGELRYLFDDQKRWGRKVLLPYQTPTIGIRVADKSTTFAIARAKIDEFPDNAANDARKIMDIELGLLAEALEIKMPYVRGDKNDRRVAHDFLQRLISDGKKCFKLKVDKECKPYNRAIELLAEADRRILAWGNRGSHTFDVAKPEATSLIDACEAALRAFTCVACKKRVTFAKVGDDRVQCECSELQWRRS